MVTCIRCSCGKLPCRRKTIGATIMMKKMAHIVRSAMCTSLIVPLGLVLVSEPAYSSSNCYWGLGADRTTINPGNIRPTLVVLRGKNTRSCSDLNVHIEVQNPRDRNCRVSLTVKPKGQGATIVRDLIKNRWIVMVRNLKSDWDGSLTVPPSCGKATFYQAS